jgi:predicted nucleic acid-binding protein
MARYLLDTNIVSYLLDTASTFHGVVHRHLAALGDGDEVALSVLSLYELHHWFAHDPARQASAEEVIRDFTLLPLPERGAELFGALMRDLRAGGPRQRVERHAVDCMIAVTALEHRAVLVSNDALFERVAALMPVLELGSWTGG